MSISVFADEIIFDAMECAIPPSWRALCRYFPEFSINLGAVCLIFRSSGTLISLVRGRRALVNICASLFYCALRARSHASRGNWPNGIGDIGGALYRAKALISVVAMARGDRRRAREFARRAILPPVSCVRYCPSEPSVGAC